MRSQFAVYLVLAMAIAGMIFSMSGFNAVIGQDGHNSDLSGRVNDSAENSSVNSEGDTFNADARAQGGTLVGFILTGGSAIMDVLSLVVLLPLELQAMGFPYWFAYPIGVLVEVVVGVGFIQFIVGRVYR